MKTSLKLFISAIAISLLASIPTLRAADDATTPPAQGQGGQRGQKGGGRGAGRGGMTIESIETAVGKLTDDQKSQINAILKKVQEARQAARGSGGGGGDQKANMAKMQELRTQTNADIRAVLTEEQQKKFDAMAQGGRGQGGQRRKQN